ncbi:TraB/GumN family protein [Sphingomonas crocodyli]|uniref:TraB/GumN family protein n=1 Tax=Sphingomonas crocodyli TaxID=1979270 RepID=A0A437LVM6_9SPHN|nr:TraB/GumN family protein [Sphingomonas crocodyli]RVT89432.1 TraB/GumN family protein [Sphingomonas crocodyli]
MKWFRRLTAALLSLILAAPVAAAPSPAMWKFGDADTTIYLYGTIHALPANFRWRDAKLERVMASADTLVIETMIDKDPAAIARLMPPPDPSLPSILDRVPAKSRAPLSAMIAKAGLSPAQLDPMPTWQAAFYLMGAMMRDIGAERGAGVEQNLTPAFESGVSGPRKIEALETASSQLKLFEDLSEADQRELLAGLVDGSGDAKRDYAKMLKAWAAGDEKAIAKTFADDEDLTPHLRDVLLKKRNEAWTVWLKDRLNTPGTVLVAVGAGHLAGPLSVQSMLAAQGVKVERVR